MRREERGLVLVLAVFAVALLLVLSVGLTTAVRAELLASSASLTRSQALFLAEAGLNQARAILLYEDLGSDTLQDDWGPDAEFPLDAPQQLGPGYYRVRVYDACGRIDINTADFDTLTRLTGDPDVANAIIDWRSQGQLTEYYRGLPVPYDPRRGRFQTPGELLLVKGVTPDLYFGTPDRRGLRDLVTVFSPSLNTTADGQLRTNLNDIVGASGNDAPGQENSYLNALIKQYGNSLKLYDLQQIEAVGTRLHQDNPQFTFTSLGQLALCGFNEEMIVRTIDFFTAVPGGAMTIERKVNVNTAPAEVLAALPGSSREIAEALVRGREKQPYRTLGQAAKVILSSGGQHAFERMIDSLNTKSSGFIIDSMGYTDASRGFRRLVALVRRIRYPRFEQVPIVHEVEEDVPLPPSVTGVAVNALSRRPGLAPS